jgi:hypothetical protein
MSTTRRFKGEYAPDGQQRRRNVRAEAGHRCIRCGHPFECGKHGKGEWSPCDARCEHGRPYRVFDVGGWRDIAGFMTAGSLVKDGWMVEAQWRILTTHHLDGDKSNDQWWNTLSLCQRCHLQVQTRIDPHIPYFLEQLRAALNERDAERARVQVLTASLTSIKDLIGDLDEHSSDFEREMTGIINGALNWKPQ